MILIVSDFQSCYSQEILNFIDADSDYFEPIAPVKFAIAGGYLADLAEVLDYSSDRWLRNWLNESYGVNEYCEVESDWSDWLASRTQQYVSVNFLSKYQTEPAGNNYPQERESWSKTLEPKPVIETDTQLHADKSFVGQIMTAHAEDIRQWSNSIAEMIPRTGSITFARLKQVLSLTPAQIYLGIILSDRFVLESRGEVDFYSGFSIFLL